jgi:hypothetical protein
MASRIKDAEHSQSLVVVNLGDRLNAALARVNGVMPLGASVFDAAVVDGRAAAVEPFDIVAWARQRGGVEG